MSAMARILLVDDEEPLRAFLKRGLELDGHAVTTATDGGDGLDRLGEAGGGRAVFVRIGEDGDAFQTAQVDHALRFGVFEAQRALRRTPNTTVVGDGMFGPLTEAATKEGRHLDDSDDDDNAPPLPPPAGEGSNRGARVKEEKADDGGDDGDFSAFSKFFY